MANEALYAELLSNFDAAGSDPGMSAEDRHVLECAAADVADCSAREVITFLLPVLDSHADGQAARKWTGVDAALLRALLIALRRVRPKQRLGMLADCLQALQRQLSRTLQHGDIPQATLGNEGGGSNPATTSGPENIPMTEGLERIPVPVTGGPESIPVTGGIGWDVAAFVSGAFAACSSDSDSGCGGGGEVTPTEVDLAPQCAEQLSGFVLAVLSLAVTAAVTHESEESDASLGAAPLGGATYAEQQQQSTATAATAAEDPFLQMYGTLAACALARVLLGCLPGLGIGSTETLGGVVNRPRGRIGIPGRDSWGTREPPAGWAQLGLAAVTHAAWLEPALGLLLRAAPEDRLLGALHATKVLLILASEHRSVRLSLAALRVVAVAGGRQRGEGRRAGPAALPALLVAGQELVMSMVQHPVAPVRSAACRSLQALIGALEPGVQLAVIDELLGSPFPSVAAILLQQLKQLIAESWPPPPGPVQLAAQWLQVGDDVDSLVSNAEPVCAALNIFRFMLLREGGSGQVAKQIAQHEVRQRTIELLSACEPVLAAPQLQAADVNAARALERVCEVASRVLELFDESTTDLQ